MSIPSFPENYFDDNHASVRAERRKENHALDVPGEVLPEDVMKYLETVRDTFPKIYKLQKKESK